MIQFCIYHFTVLSHYIILDRFYQYFQSKVKISYNLLFYLVYYLKIVLHI